MNTSTLIPMTSAPRPAELLRSYGIVRLDNTPYSASLHVYFATPDEARTLVAQLPKSYRARGGAISDGRSPAWGSFTVEAITKASGANGGVNESGVDRIRRSILKLRALGYEVVYTPLYSNSSTLAEAAEILGLDVA